MKTKQIKKSIDVKAPREKVWDVLMNEKFTKQWYAAFSESTHAQTDWRVGSKVVFVDNNKSGVFGKIIVNKPSEEVAIEYEGIVANGKEDYDSEIARAFKGAIERYKLAGTNGSTHVDIEVDMGEPYYDSMSAAWDKALQHIRKLAEGK